MDLTLHRWKDPISEKHRWQPNFLFVLFSQPFHEPLIMLPSWLNWLLFGKLVFASRAPVRMEWTVWRGVLYCKHNHKIVRVRFSLFASSSQRTCHGFRFKVSFLRSLSVFTSVSVNLTQKWQLRCLEITARYCWFGRFANFKSTSLKCFPDVIYFRCL